LVRLDASGQNRKAKQDSHSAQYRHRHAATAAAVSDAVSAKTLVTKFFKCFTRQFPSSQAHGQVTGSTITQIGNILGYFSLT